MTEPLRILHCMRAPVGGLFRHVRDLAIEQAARGHLVGVLCDSLAADRLTEERLEALRPHLRLGLSRTPMQREPSWRDPVAWWATRDLAKALRVDVLHGHGAKGGAFARLAKRSMTGKAMRPACFYTPHGGSLNFSPKTPKGAIYMGLERFLEGATDGLVFESDFVRRIYMERIPQCRTPARVVYNGLKPDEFAPVDWRSDAAEFLYLGELRQVKGVDTLLKAFKIIRNRQPARLVVFGDGPDAEQLKALARDLGLDGDVTFPGAKPIREAFTLGRCMVMPSRAESFPYVALETAAAGIPFIATSVGGIPEIVAQTDTELIEPNDIEALAEVMQGVLDDYPAALQRAKRLKTRVAELFTVTTMTDHVLDFYRDILSKRTSAYLRQSG